MFSSKHKTIGQLLLKNYHSTPIIDRKRITYTNAKSSIFINKNKGCFSALIRSLGTIELSLAFM